MDLPTLFAQGCKQAIRPEGHTRADQKSVSRPQFGSERRLWKVKKNGGKLVELK